MGLTAVCAILRDAKQRTSMLRAVALERARKLEGVLSSLQCCHNTPIGVESCQNKPWNTHMSMPSIGRNAYEFRNALMHSTTYISMDQLAQTARVQQGHFFRRSVDFQHRILSRASDILPKEEHIERQREVGISKCSFLAGFVVFGC